MIVNTKLACGSRKYVDYVTTLAKRYPDVVHLHPMGHSVWNTPLYAIQLGEGPTSCIITGAHHGLEWMTSLLLLHFVELVCLHAHLGRQLLDYDIPYLLGTRCAYLVPMVNPDGVDIALRRIPTEHLHTITAMCPWEELSTRWQANAHGVDLNHNYPAAWQQGQDLERKYGIFGPGPTRYGGTAPESEPETRALMQLTRSLHPSRVIAYHSQGEVIYDDFQGYRPKGTSQLSQLFCSVSGYTVDAVRGIAAARGYKDWFIQEFDRPGFTVEVGCGFNPLPIEQFDDIFHKNLEMMLMAWLL